MAVSKIKVNTNSLDRTRSELQDKLTKIKADMDKITDAIEHLNATWVGDDHDTFEKVANADLAFLSGVCDELQGIISYEADAVSEYDKCEQKVADLISRIKI